MIAWLTVSNNSKSATVAPSPRKEMEESTSPRTPESGPGVPHLAHPGPRESSELLPGQIFSCSRSIHSSGGRECMPARVAAGERVVGARAADFSISKHLGDSFGVFTGKPGTASGCASAPLPRGWSASGRAPVAEDRGPGRRRKRADPDAGKPGRDRALGAELGRTRPGAGVAGLEEANPPGGGDDPVFDVIVAIASGDFAGRKKRYRTHCGGKRRRSEAGIPPRRLLIACTRPVRSRAMGVDLGEREPEISA